MLLKAAKGPFMASMQPRQSPQTSWQSICRGGHRGQKLVRGLPDKSADVHAVV